MSEPKPEPGHVHYEKRDVDAPAVLRAAGVLVVVTVATAMVVLGFFRYLSQAAARHDRPPAPLARPDTGLMPPPPRLQTAPALDLARFRSEEEETLATYGWVDKEAGVVRIPIEQAMRLVAERGLPVPPPLPAAAKAAAGEPGATPGAAKEPAPAKASGGEKKK